MKPIFFIFLHSSHSALTNACFFLRKKSVAVLSSSRNTSSKLLESQLSSMWPGMHRSSQLLPGDILRRTMLTSAVNGIQLFSPASVCKE